MAADLNKITIPGMLVQFPDFFYSMYKNNDFERGDYYSVNFFGFEICCWCNLIGNRLLGGASAHGDAKKRSYQFGLLVNVRVWNHIYRKQMVVPTMCKLVLFGPFNVQTCFI